MDDEQPKTSGSVPNAYGNAIARRWAPELPRQLTGGFLTLLYALRALASADGRLRYERDGKPITIQQITRACRSDQKDVRTYLQAAVAAGVVAIDEESDISGQDRGRATLYRLVVCPWPDWQAAAGIVWVAQQVKAEKRATRAAKKAAAEQPAAPTAPEGSGDSHPTSTPAEGSGDSHPTFPEQGSGDSAPTGVGGQSSSEVGGQCPDHPCSTHELPQDMVAVGPQAEAAREPEEDQPAAVAPPPPRLVPPQPGGDRPKGRKVKTGSSQGQRPLLLPVRTPPHVSEDKAQLRASATPEDIRRAIAQLGKAKAVDLYGHRLVAPYLIDPQTDTGT